jgi:hypothetical protein
MTRRRWSRVRWYVAVAGVFGLLLGLVIGNFHKDQPVKAWGVDRVDNFIIATGPVDGEVEAVYFLDSMTGVLTARVLSKIGNSFQASFSANVGGDLKTLVEGVNTRIRAETNSKKRVGPPRPEIQLPQNPKYVMTTGMADLLRGKAMPPGMRPAAAVVYVVEVNTGVMVVYGVPWSSEYHTTGRLQAAQLQFLVGDQVTIPAVSP